MSVANIHKDEEYDVYIGRPSVWQNLYTHLSKAMKPGMTFVGTRDEAVRRYAEDLAKNVALIERAQAELKGKTLGCFCAPASCHGEVLAAVAALDTVDEAVKYLTLRSAEPANVFTPQ